MLSETVDARGKLRLQCSSKIVANSFEDIVLNIIAVEK